MFFGITMNQKFITDLYDAGKLCDCYELHKVYKEGNYKWSYLEVSHKRNCKGRWTAMDLLQELNHVKVQSK